jgi:hypothetical protein
MSTARIVFTTLLVSAIVSATAASADVLLDGSEFQVNTYTTGSQEINWGRSVARAADGSFLVVWKTIIYVDGNPVDGPDGSKSSVHGQRFDSTGAPAGTEFQVNTYTTSWQDYPAVSAAPDGGFVVVWNSDGPDGDSHSVQGQRYDAAGTTLGTEFTVNSYATHFQGYPGVAVASDGRFVVVWTSYGQDGDGTSVHGQRYDSTGLPAGTEFQVNTYTTSWQTSPGVSAAPDGSFVVVWTSYYQDGSGTSVHGQRFDSTGLPAGTEFQVNSYTTGDQGGYHPAAVASTADGSFVVAWNSWGQDGSSQGAFGQRYDAAGAAVGTEFQINSYTTGWQGAPAVAAAADGSFVVVWSDDAASYNFEVQARRFDATGAAVGTEFQVNTYTTGAQGYGIAIAVDAAGDFVVVWGSFAGGSAGQDGSDSGVFGQRLCADTDADLVCDSATVGDESVDEPVAAGGTVTTDSEADGSTPSDPIETWVTSPNAGTITITENIVSTDPPVFDITISAPTASAADPLVLEFRVDATLATSFVIRKNGVPVAAECTGTPGTASPDPCVDSTTVLPDGDVHLTLLTSTASVWRLEEGSPTTAVCPSTPAAGCITGSKASIQLKDNGNDAKDQIKWKLSGAGLVTQSDLGDPITSRTYALCIYDETASSPALVAALEIAPSTSWDNKDPKGFNYKDRAGSSDGVTKAQLKTGQTGKSMASVSAKGTAIPMPSPITDAKFFDQDTKVTVQVVNDETGTCWTSEFSTATKNGGGQFKAKSP